MSSKTGAISVEPTTQLQDLDAPEKPSLRKGSTPSPEGRRNRKGRGPPGRGASASMASRGVIGVFLLSALPLLCLELRRGIPHLEEEEKNEEKQKLVRKKQQEAQGEKASRYIENVLKPHQEMKLRKLEERFYQMTGETWKLSNGHKLGGDEDLVLENEAFKTSNREAAKRRNLPKLLTKISPSAEQPTRKEVLDLPEEPPERAEEVVTVALRCPSGSVLRRRFFKSCSSQIYHFLILRWMKTWGRRSPVSHPGVSKIDLFERERGRVRQRGRGRESPADCPLSVEPGWGLRCLTPRSCPEQKPMQTLSQLSHPGVPCFTL
ncbi:UBX domain-containing protein 8 isoform X3 [Lutra lutra]|uniref:UBX domain-containing protein 8 isoform X3 n=1 Tax=Lutra lutra TaxID=9657 RepID=UPI001FD09B1F|nr:UBX domain-containing protein 8 isoform X3 [Lutra lutra]